MARTKQDGAAESAAPSCSCRPFLTGGIFGNHDLPRLRSRCPGEFDNLTTQDRNQHRQTINNSSNLGYLSISEESTSFASKFSTLDKSQQSGYVTVFLRLLTPYQQFKSANRKLFATSTMSSDRSSPESDTTMSWADNVWMGDPDGDMTLEFEGRSWRVKEYVISTHFRWMDTAFPDRAPVNIYAAPQCIAS